MSTFRGDGTWKCLQESHNFANIRNKSLSQAAAKILPDHHSQDRNVLRVRRHCVGRNYPPVFSQMVCYLEYRVPATVFQRERYKWHADVLGHNLKLSSFLNSFFQNSRVRQAIFHHIFVALSARN
ncbi:hypothetical protein KIW84_062119, partial [Lathyrus oleraceus]